MERVNVAFSGVRLDPGAARGRAQIRSTEPALGTGDFRAHGIGVDRREPPGVPAAAPIACTVTGALLTPWYSPATFLPLSTKYDERVIDPNPQFAFVAPSRGEGRRHERPVHGDLNLERVPGAQQRRGKGNTAVAATGRIGYE